jgi:hypothetical protein
MITLYNEQEELNESVNEELIEESFQIGDAVKLDKEKGFVIGEINGELIIQVQGSTHRVKPNSKKLKGEKLEKVTTEPHMKFDKVSQKLLFEQYVKCGIFVGNTPVKIDHCYTKFSDFNNKLSNSYVILTADFFALSNEEFFSASLIIFETSSLERVEAPSIFIDCSIPVFSSRADTDNKPLTSNWKVTFILGTPLGAEGIPVKVNTPKLLLSFAKGRSPCKT